MEKNTTTMKIKKLHILTIQIFKTINNINPSLIKDTFTLKKYPNIRPFSIRVKHPWYGDKKA